MKGTPENILLRIDIVNTFPELDEEIHEKIFEFVSDDRVRNNDLKSRVDVLYDLISGINANNCEMEGRIMRLEHQE